MHNNNNNNNNSYSNIRYNCNNRKIIKHINISNCTDDSNNSNLS